jgi:hypothetical protein
MGTGPDGKNDKALERALAVRDQRRGQAVERPLDESAREAERREMDEIDRRLTDRAEARRVAGTSMIDPSRRAKPRFDVPASLILDRGGSVAVYVVVDLSATGALFSVGSASTEGLDLWSRHAATIVADEDAKLQVELEGRIARCVGDTFALDWSGDEKAQDRVARLLDLLSRPRAPSEEERQRAEIDEIDQRLESLVGNPHPHAPEEPRAKARLIVSATMLIEHDGRAEELVLINVSRTGGLIASAGAILSRLRIGTLLLMTLKRSDAPAIGVDVVARVVRHDGHATGVDWSEDAAAEYGIALFLDEVLRRQADEAD